MPFIERNLTIVLNQCSAYLIVYVLTIVSAQQLGGQTSLNREQIKHNAEQAQADLQNRKLELAVREYQDILAVDPNNVSAHANIGVAYYMENSFKQAAEHFGAALSRQHNLWNTLALLGMSEKQLGQNIQAEAHLKDAFAHVEEKELHTAVGKQLFILYIQAGKLIQAAAVVGQLQGENPSDVDILYAAHRVYSELADTTLYSIAVLQPDSARLYQSKGDQLAQQGNTAGAIAAYRQALERDPHLPGAHYELAEIMSASISSAERAQAETEYRSALADNPLDEKAECGLASMELERSDFQMASQDYTKAIRLQPDDPVANEGLGMALVSLGEEKRARPYLEHAAQLDPTNGRAHYHLSLVDHKLGDATAAKQEMDEFLRLKVGQERIDQTLKGMHGQLLMQIQKDRNADASIDTAPK
jgi:tetratricopeptide (TPR) repeat protein